MKKYLLLGLAFSLLSTGIYLAAKNTILKPTYQDHEGFPIFRNGPPATKSDLPVSDKKRKIQVALLLDTSNSMDGLIEQAKSQLWTMVNELANTKKDGESPGLEIALYEYGNSGLSAMNGYVRQVAPLTTDLDYISEQLFAMRTNGGEEWCGWVLKDALGNLKWTENTDDLKLIVVAGNEPFDQGGVNYQEFCEKAGQRNILVNTIFCGDYNEGVATHWKKGADIAGGSYVNINENDVVEHIPTPYDDKVMELNGRLNSTFISYGAQGEAKASNLAAQDANALNYSAANARTRSFFKSKEQYSSADWDIVSASAADSTMLTEAEDLPENMKGMSADERKAFVETKRTEREAIQKELREYEQKVNEFVAAERRKSAGKQTLDNVLLDCMKKQAKAKGFENN